MSDTDSDTPATDSLDELLFQCLDRDESAWGCALESLCEEHPEQAEALRERITLLREIGFAGDAPAAAPVADYRDFGDYELLRELGAGGMGVVYLARQKSMNRKVALKLIRRDQLRFSRSLARFRREITLAARLEHPGICLVYAAGEHEGVPYIAMRYIEGKSLPDHFRKLAAEGSGSRSHRGAADRVQAAVAIMEKVALAVQAAHEAGLVHRDIKPGNIMIDDSGEPVILDFGLAHEEDSTEATLTRTGDRVGTPAYMAPEQVEGRRDAIGRTTDVYGLGATLYECLTGQCPFQAPTHDALFHAILSSESPDPRKHNPAITRDLKVVVETALEKEPRRRYQSAAALAEDLRRIRCFEPILARRPGPFLRARRWSQRHPQAAMTMLSLGIGLVVALFLLAQLNRSLADTRVENLLHRSTLAMEEDGRLALQLALEAFDSRPESPDTVSQLHQVLGVFRERVCFRGHASAVWWMALSERRNLLATAGFDGFIKLWRPDGTILYQLEPRKPTAAGEPCYHYSVRFSRDGNFLLAASGITDVEGFAFLWDVRAEPRLVTTIRHADAVVSAIFSADESRILTTAMNGAFSLHDRNGASLWTRRLEQVEGNCFLEADVSPAGDRFVLRNLNPYDRTLISAELWNLDGERLPGFDGQRVSATRFSADGKRLLTGDATGNVRLWDVLERGVKKVANLDRHACRVQAVAFARDGWILTAGKDRNVFLWTPDGRFRRQIGRHPSFVRSIHFSPDGGTIAVQVGRGKIEVFDRLGHRIALLAGHRQSVNSLLFSDDGNRVFTCSSDHTVRKWVLQESELPVFFGHGAAVNSLDCIRLPENGDLSLVSGSDDGHAALWDGNGRLLHSFPHATEVSCVRFSPAGTELVSGDVGGTVRLFDRASRGELWALRERSFRIDLLTFLSERRFIAAYRWYRTYPHVWQWSRSGASRIRSLGKEENAWPNDMLPIVHARSDNELLYFTESGERKVLRFGLVGEKLETIEGSDPWGLEETSKEFGMWRAAVAPDGETFVLGNRRGELLVLPRHGTPRRIRAHAQAVNSLSFSPDSSSLLSTSEDGTAQLRDRSGTLLATYRGHAGAVNAGVFAPDGRRVFTASGDGTIRTWFVRREDIEDLARRRLAEVR
jgi:serine/threonine protein kinase/WD40 repeat protein